MKPEPKTDTTAMASLMLAYEEFEHAEAEHKRAADMLQNSMAAVIEQMKLIRDARNAAHTAIHEIARLVVANQVGDAPTVAERCILNLCHGVLQPEQTTAPIQSEKETSISDQEKKYEVWFEPTEKGIRVFNWQAHLCGPTGLTLESANAMSYEYQCEERGSDAAEYGNYVVREVKK